MHAQSFRKCLLAFLWQFEGSRTTAKGTKGATGGSTYSASASHIGGLTKVARSQYKVFEIVFQGSKLLVLFMETEELDFTQLKCEMGMLCQTLPLFEAYGVFFNTIDCRNGQSLGSCQNERICGRIHVLNGLTRLFFSSVLL